MLPSAEVMASPGPHALETVSSPVSRVSSTLRASAGHGRSAKTAVSGGVRISPLLPSLRNELRSWLLLAVIFHAASGGLNPPNASLAITGPAAALPGVDGGR